MLNLPFWCFGGFFSASHPPSDLSIYRNSWGFKQKTNPNNATNTEPIEHYMLGTVIFNIYLIIVTTL